MRNRRDRRNPNKTVKHIVNRVGHGIPFIPALIINRYIELIMAKAQELYPTQVVCFLWMGNQFHIVTVGRAELSNKEILEQIEKGVREIEKEVKAESNSFIGRKKLINSYKIFVEKCKIIWESVRENLKSGIKTIKYPSGAYMPAYALKHMAFRY